MYKTSKKELKKVIKNQLEIIDNLEMIIKTQDLEIDLLESSVTSAENALTYKESLRDTEIDYVRELFRLND